MLKIITISGLDGSGKSTQAELLKKYLEAQGKSVFYFHAVEFGIANKIISFFKKLCYTIIRSDYCVTGNQNQKSVIMARRFKIWLRKIALKIDLIRFKNLIKRLEKQGLDCILSDRYFYDNVINIAYLLGSNAPKFNKSIIKPNTAIYLKTDPEVIMQRERKPDQGIKYLQKKNALYSNTSNNWNLITVDGNNSKEKIFEEIKSLCRGSI